MQRVSPAAKRDAAARDSPEMGGARSVCGWLPGCNGCNRCVQALESSSATIGGVSGDHLPARGACHALQSFPILVQLLESIRKLDRAAGRDEQAVDTILH